MKRILFYFFLLFSASLVSQAQDAAAPNSEIMSRIGCRLEELNPADLSQVLHSEVQRAIRIINQPRVTISTALLGIQPDTHHNFTALFRLPSQTNAAIQYQITRRGSLHQILGIQGAEITNATVSPLSISGHLQAGQNEFFTVRLASEPNSEGVSADFILKCQILAPEQTVDSIQILPEEYASGQVARVQSTPISVVTDSSTQKPNADHALGSAFFLPAIGLGGF